MSAELLNLRFAAQACVGVAQGARLAAHQGDCRREGGLAVVDVADGADVHVRLQGSGAPRAP